MLERLRNRFFGKYRGVVTDVDAGTLRIKANVPAVLGQPADRLGAGLRALRRPQHGLCLPARRRLRRLDRVRGRRRLLADLGRLLLARRRAAVRRHRQRAGDRHQGRPEILLDDDGGTITIEDQNGNTVTLGSSGISLGAPAASGRARQTAASASTTARWRSPSMRGFLTTASVMMCPHGGTVQAISSNTQVMAGGAPTGEPPTPS